MKPFATANTEKILCSVGRMDAYAGCARRGTAARDNATQARRIKLWPVEDRQRRHRKARPGEARQCNAGKARRGMARPGMATQATQAWHGMSRLGTIRRGEATQAWLGKAWPGEARHGRAWQGHDTNRGARPGYKLRSFFVSKQQPTKGEHTWLAY